MVEHDPEAILPTLAVKLPFFIIGVAIGMGVVWVALQWVPGALAQALASVGG